MKRRQFLRTTAPLAIMPGVLKPFSVRAFPGSSLLASMDAGGLPNDHVLVLIFLNGGNDGLNTVVPLDQMDKLAAARGSILLPENKLLKVPSAQLGLHPSLQGMKTLLDEQKLTIVHSVGYPEPDFSHFRSTDIWASASDSSEYLDSGWMGRFLEAGFPGYPAGFPTPEMPDPLAIQIGSNMPLLFQGSAAQMAFNVSSPDIFGVNVQPGTDPAPPTPAGEELQYIRGVTGLLGDYAQRIVNAFIQGNNTYTGYPAAGSNYLADELKAVARLIKGGLKTRIYLVSLYGFDTHAQQTLSGDTAQGAHAQLLQWLDQAIFSFQRDLEKMGIADRVLGLTFSEFGRRIIANASMGTDHGAAAPLFLFGSKVNPGILGDNPILPNQATAADNIPMQYDFRSVYASVLRQWFCMDQSATASILHKDFQSLPLVADTCTTSLADVGGQGRYGLSLYPNPASGPVQIRLAAPPGAVRLELYDAMGRMLESLDDAGNAESHHAFEVDMAPYPTGNYYVRAQGGAWQRVEFLQVIR
jgi:uncharacterized protein (DUF1501 family)